MIHKGDTVMVIAGKEKGKTGKVMQIIPIKMRAIVEKLNMVKRHSRPTQKMRQGGIIEKESSIHISNLMLYCEKCKKGARVRKSIDAKNGKTRVYHCCGEKVAS